MIMINLADETQFEHILTYMAISGGVMLVLCAIIVSDDEDAEGGGGFSLSSLRDKAQTLAKGVLYSRTGYMYFGLQGLYVTVLLICLIAKSLETDTGTTALLILVGLNLVLPVLTFLKLDQETIEGWVKGVSDFEETLVTKGVDMSFSEAA